MGSCLLDHYQADRVANEAAGGYDNIKVQALDDKLHPSTLDKGSYRLHKVHQCQGPYVKA